MFDINPESNYYFITLLRHGESIGNFENRYQGQSDFPLTNTGIAQVRALAQRWLESGVRFDTIITSPLSRAKQSASIIAETLNMSYEEDPIWMERNNGILAGMKSSEADDILPRPDFITPYHQIGSTGESQWQLFSRAANAVQNLILRQPGSYLVVSHGAILNMVLYAILGIAPQANFQGARFRFQNAAFAQATYDRDNHIWLLERINDRDHWLEEDQL